MNNPASKATKTVYIIAGPTAVGKTAAALQLALQLDTEIISADSRQCYRELEIGVARPSLAELGQVKHHFIASHSITDEVNAAIFENYSLNALSGIFQSRNNAVVVGGTGLYIKALAEGIDELPKVDIAIRNKVIEDYSSFGLSWLQEQVKQLDPIFFAGQETQNPQRLMRAMEVIMSTGKSIRSYQTGNKTVRPFTIKKFGLFLPREELYARIAIRVDQMIEAGLVSEAENCYREFILNPPGKQRPVPALNTVGYAELFDYFKGLTTLPVAIELIKQHTRNYAKRQLTWFRKDTSITWLSPGEFFRSTMPQQ